MKNLIVISAPSGAGKSTLCEEIRRINPNIKFSISCTTRPKRDYEIEGVNYYFLTNNEFMDKVNNNELVEYEQVHGYYYGTLSNTLKKAIDSEELILFDVDVKGAMSIKKKYPNNTLTIFILPPSLDDLKMRLMKRGTDSIEIINKRLERTNKEMKFKDKFDTFMINDDLSNAIKKLNEIISNQNQGVIHGS
ncbi:MAG: guanylate kinase [Candidatus Neomarinimicrobiota bacterium]|jgi:guanylate kinase|nr:guanylate kinase [Candidatus Neomarinimicrobiota bacterium]|tara:strand:+ start:1040 stop:1615 length:576 start_codon:yes stop_codon:yes gene_type:complete